MATTTETVTEEPRPNETGTKIPKHLTPYLKLKQTMLEEKLENLQKELSDIENNKHPRLVELSKELQQQAKQRIQSATEWKEYQLSKINEEYEIEARHAQEDFLSDKSNLRDTMFRALGDRAKSLNDKSAVNLIQNIYDGTRKSRRRRGETPEEEMEVKSSQKKAKTTATIQHKLKDFEILQDLATIKQKMSESKKKN